MRTGAQGVATGNHIEILLRTQAWPCYRDLGAMSRFHSRGRAAFPLYVSVVCLSFAFGLSSFSPNAHASSDEGAWLEKAAEQAVVAGQFPRAVALLHGLQALRPKDP